MRYLTFQKACKKKLCLRYCLHCLANLSSVSSLLVGQLKVAFGVGGGSLFRKSRVKRISRYISVNPMVTT